MVSGRQRSFRDSAAATAAGTPNAGRKIGSSSRAESPARLAPSHISIPEAISHSGMKPSAPAARQAAYSAMPPCRTIAACMV
ncbi:hypothetical protein, partial [Chromobacterium subtsugae]|uniref:hypothetical protein n=1 Tax=Chromobacterium subtsugae TaxID=251747 RepID=UPI001C10FC51